NTAIRNGMITPMLSTLPEKPRTWTAILKSSTRASLELMMVSNPPGNGCLGSTPPNGRPGAYLAPMALAQGGASTRFSAPEVLEPMRRHLGVTHRVLDVLVPEPSL